MVVLIILQRLMGWLNAILVIADRYGLWCLLLPLALGRVSTSLLLRRARPITRLRLGSRPLAAASLFLD